jgi:hypothetical protein
MTAEDVDEGKLDADRAVVEALQKLPALSIHASRILMPLSQMIDGFTATSELARNQRSLKFFSFIKDTFPDEGYAVIQREHLSPKNIDFMHSSGVISSELKYLDFPFWAQSKFAVGSRLKLERYAGESILDIGTGPGHFAVVARYFGCKYEGLEVILKSWSPHSKRHLFDDLCNFFQIDRATQPVRPMKPLQLQQRFRMVTCLMGNFCSVTAADGKRRSWDWSEWVFFLDNLVRDVMEAEYSMYFHISRNYLSADVVENIRKFATLFDEERSVFTFDESLDLDELRRSSPANP